MHFRANMLITPTFFRALFPLLCLCRTGIIHVSLSQIIKIPTWFRADIGCRLPMWDRACAKKIRLDFVQCLSRVPTCFRAAYSNTSDSVSCKRSAKTPIWFRAEHPPSTHTLSSLSSPFGLNYNILYLFLKLDSYLLWRSSIQKSTEFCAVWTRLTWVFYHFL